MSIVAIFLCWPFAIPAIMAASKVNPLLQQGNYGAAQAAATESRKWSKIALIVGICLWAVSIVCCVIGVIINVSSSTSA
ncbi:CD225/dispanin family protein [Plantactinospora soyae]|uniref:ABC-type Fe3+ transport system permease subunit n=1 Tax=Plantactinospora soyae TaxID=1544732 RepID=A0A927QW19_9ACTN|nr:ABC-type Fe3+ transport system permease subunit [Plantactinospora soyae]